MAATIEVGITTGLWSLVFYGYGVGPSLESREVFYYNAGMMNLPDEIGGSSGLALPDSLGAVPIYGIFCGAQSSSPFNSVVVVVLPDSVPDNFVLGISVDGYGDLGAPDISGAFVYEQFNDSPLDGVKAWMWYLGNSDQPLGDPFSTGESATVDIVFAGDASAFWTDFQTSYELI